MTDLKKVNDGADKYLAENWTGKADCQFHLEYKKFNDKVKYIVEDRTLKVDCGTHRSQEDSALHKSTYTRNGNGTWVHQHSYQWPHKDYPINYAEEDIKGSEILKEMYNKFGITQIVFFWQNK